jgi:hypothetical protein
MQLGQERTRGENSTIRHCNVRTARADRRNGPRMNFAQFRLPSGSVWWHTTENRQRGDQNQRARSLQQYAGMEVVL